MPLLLHGNGVKLTGIEADAALDAFFLENLVNYLFRALDGFRRTLDAAQLAAIAVGFVYPVSDQGLADLGRAFLVPDVGLIFIPEVPDGGEHGVGGRTSQADREESMIISESSINFSMSPS